MEKSCNIKYGMTFVAGMLAMFLLVNLFSNNPLTPSFVSTNWCGQMMQMHQSMHGSNAGNQDGGGMMSGNMMNTGITGTGMMEGGFGTGWFGMGGTMLFGWVLSLVFWIAIIWLIVFAIQNRRELFRKAK